jgi:hypothetical protein
MAKTTKPCKCCKFFIAGSIAAALIGFAAGSWTTDRVASAFVRENMALVELVNTMGDQLDWYSDQWHDRPPVDVFGAWQ